LIWSPTVDQGQTPQACGHRSKCTACIDMTSHAKAVADASLNSRDCASHYRSCRILPVHRVRSIDLPICGADHAPRRRYLTDSGAIPELRVPAAFTTHGKMAPAIMRKLYLNPRLIKGHPVQVQHHQHSKGLRCFKVPLTPRALTVGTFSITLISLNILKAVYFRSGGASTSGMRCD
jgi:hypothetical protein